MLIDSHAHYSHKLYAGEFDYLDHQGGGFCVSRADLGGMLEAMAKSGIELCIEPSTSLDKIEEQIAFVKAHAPYMHLALGVHPKNCALSSWEDREKLRRFVIDNQVIAVGETGLDYSLGPDEAEKQRQTDWFCYQIGLAHERQLPLILHIRDADREALEILRAHRDRLCGGVAHCFHGDAQTAMAFTELGFALGIGGKLLQANDEGRLLRETVKHVPLTAILVETDAPYIKPDISHLGNGRKQRSKVRNSSLILPAVIDTIAQLRGENRERVEETIYTNTLRVFRLKESGGAE